MSEPLVWPGRLLILRACPVFLRGYRACSSVWLERALDKREVGSSSLPRPTILRPSGFGWQAVPAGLHSGFRLLIGAVAQLGERLLCKQEVVGSIPSGSTINRPQSRFILRRECEASATELHDLSDSAAAVPNRKHRNYKGPLMGPGVSDP